MSDHGTHHHSDSSHEANGDLKSKTAFRSSFWFVVILVGLFIAAINFIKIEGNASEGHSNHEATSNEMLKGESGLGRPEPNAMQPAGIQTAPDSSGHEGMNK